MTHHSVRIPADADIADKVIGPLTARQLGILTVAGLLLYITWTLTRGFLPVPLYLAVAIPVGATATILAVGQRDGISLDRLLLAAIRQRLQPRHQVAAPEGVRPAPEWLTAQTTSRPGRTAATRHAPTTASVAGQVSPVALRLPAESVTDTGVIDLGVDGLAVAAVASTVNFALRTPAEQQALVASFGRYLHSLTAPVQVLVRTERLDLSEQVSQLRTHAGGLPHPSLEQAALEHADYLAQLGTQSDLLRRQVLLVLREPVTGALAAPTAGLAGPSPAAALTALWSRTGRGERRGNAHYGEVDAGVRRAAESRLMRRLGEAIDLLAPAGIVVTPLDAGQATAVLAAACNPDSLLPPSAGLAGADEVITTAAVDAVEHASDDNGNADGWADDWDYEDREDEDPDYPDEYPGTWGRL